MCKVHSSSVLSKIMSMKANRDGAVYDGEPRYCLSPSLVQAALKAKVTRLTDETIGLFGPYEKATLGEMGDAKEETPKPFPTVSRAAGRDGVGDGRGVGEEVQRGVSSLPRYSRRPGS